MSDLDDGENIQRVTSHLLVHHPLVCFSYSYRFISYHVCRIMRNTYISIYRSIYPQFDSSTLNPNLFSSKENIFILFRCYRTQQSFVFHNLTVFSSLLIADVDIYMTRKDRWFFERLIERGEIPSQKSPQEWQILALTADKNRVFIMNQASINMN